jgi:hypothetical protein
MQDMPRTHVTDEKPVISFRMSFRLSAWLKDVSAARGWSMNEYVVRVLDGLRDGWALPIMIRDVLEADRKAMGMDEYDYVCHLVASRYNQIRDQGGPGFEKKSKGHR